MNVTRPVLLILGAAILAGVVFFAPLHEWLTGFLQRLDDLGYWGPVLLVLVYVAGTVVFFPGAILSLGAGAIFGFPVAYVAVTIGSVLGACAAFFLGRTVARRWVESKVARNPKFRAIDRAVGEQGFKIVLLTRLSPIFPFNLVNYAFGLTRVSFHDYALASLLGMIPGTAMYVAMGAGAGSLARVLAGDYEMGPGQQVLLALGLIATAGIVITLTIGARRALRQVLQQRIPHGD